MTFDAYDVVVVPFPFTDSSKQKRRPALVISSASSFNTRIKHSIMAMVTSARNAPWPLDVKIDDLRAAGLSSESVVRMKIFTLDQRFVMEKIGSLSTADRKSVSQSIRKALSEIVQAT